MDLIPTILIIFKLLNIVFILCLFVYCYVDVFFLMTKARADMVYLYMIYVILQQ